MCIKFDIFIIITANKLYLFNFNTNLLIYKFKIPGLLKIN